MYDIVSELPQLLCLHTCVHICTNTLTVIIHSFSVHHANIHCLNTAHQVSPFLSFLNMQVGMKVSSKRIFFLFILSSLLSSAAGTCVCMCVCVCVYTCTCMSVCVFILCMCVFTVAVFSATVFSCLLLMAFFTAQSWCKVSCLHRLQDYCSRMSVMF